jgi:hypothetical protein
MAKLIKQEAGIEWTATIPTESIIFIVPTDDEGKICVRYKDEYNDECHIVCSKIIFSA